jgi:phosphatidate cytidylyltransferase
MAALVLAPLALLIAYAGGVWWQVLAIAVGAGLFAEWAGIIGILRRPVLLGVGLGGLVLAGLAHMSGHPVWITVIAAGAIAALALLAPAGLRGWSAGGFVYALAALLGAAILRADPVMGLIALLFVFAIVWATDILGYFVGRGVGGPKLWPRVSPKKTWSGAFGGLAGSAAVAVLFAAAGLGRAGPLVLLALVLSAVSQAGDLFESAVKRRFDVKDSSHIIPGHGGLMDRLDGFIAVVVAATLLGAARGGLEGAARGLLVW